MANADCTQLKLKVMETDWGEIIEGSKDDLQGLGIAVGMAFPGEPDGPKRQLSVRDPRGFSVRVKRNYGDTGYAAFIDYPGREPSHRLARQSEEFAPGVRLFRDVSWFDEYIGTAESLAAAGLVRVDQLPGQPGMRKVRVTILSDGTIPSGPPTVNHRGRTDPGSKSIERASKTTYLVRIYISKEEAERRWNAGRNADDEYKTRMRALPRPVSLVKFATKFPRKPERLPADFLTKVSWADCAWQPHR